MRVHYNYTQEEIDFLKSIVKGRILYQVNELYKEKFNKTLTVNELYAFRRRYKIKAGTFYRGGKYVYEFTDDEIKWLTEVVSGENTSKQIIKMYKEKYGKELTYNKLQRFKVRYKVKSGIDGCFGKGNPLNGNPPAPIGSERVFYEKGNINQKRTRIKVAPYKWVEKQRYVYEQHYGKIPKNCVIIFLDGNRDNFDIKNLKCITHKEHEIMAGNNLYFKNKELNETSIAIAKLMEKMKEVQ